MLPRAKARLLRLFGNGLLLLLAVHEAMEGSWGWAVVLVVTVAWNLRDRLRRWGRGAPEVVPPPGVMLVQQLHAARYLAQVRRRLAVLFAVWLVLRVGAEVAARQRLASYARRNAVEVEAERRELAALTLPGATREADAAPEYERLFERAGAPDEASSKKVRAWVRRVQGSTRDEAARQARARAAELAELRQAVACARCAWVVDRAPDLLAGDEQWRRGSLLGTLLVFEGQELGAAGRVSEAAAAYVDALRFACHLAPRDLYSHLGACGIAIEALRGLGTLVARAPRDRLGELAFVGEALATLDPALPSARLALRCERLSGMSYARVGEKTFLGSTLTFGHLVFPERVFYAHFLPTHERLVASLEAACSKETRRQREALQRAVEAEASSSWNPMVSIAIPNLCRLADFEAEVRARQRLVQAALELERAGDLRSAPVARPDPLALDGEPLRFRSQGPSAYELWSVGLNGRDDGGRPGDGDQGDLVLARKR